MTVGLEFCGSPSVLEELRIHQAKRCSPREVRKYPNQVKGEPKELKLRRLFFFLPP